MNGQSRLPLFGKLGRNARTCHLFEEVGDLDGKGYDVLGILGCEQVLGARGVLHGHELGCQEKRRRYGTNSSAIIELVAASVRCRAREPSVEATNGRPLEVHDVNHQATIVAKPVPASASTPKRDRV